MDGAKKAVVNDLAAAMEKAGIAGAQTADQVIATGDYKQIPKSRRYGMMAGMVVHKRDRRRHPGRRISSRQTTASLIR